MRVLVGADGLVKAARILDGLPDGLNDEAFKVVYQMKFKPAMKDGNPVDYWIPIYMDFNLK